MIVAGSWWLVSGCETFCASLATMRLTAALATSHHSSHYFSFRLRRNRV